MVYQIALNPGHDQGGQPVDLHVGQWAALGDMVPALDATAAAGAGGVLGGKDGMTPIRRLFAILEGLGRTDPFGQHLVCMTIDGSLPLGPGIGTVLGRQAEPGAKMRAPQAGQGPADPGGHILLA